MQHDIEYRRREDEGSDVSTRLTYLLIGGSIGAILALLFAPKSGQELRGDIADATRKGIDRSRETAAQLGTKAGEYYEATRERAADLYSSAADRAGNLADTAREAAARKSGQLSAAIEAGKQAYTEEKRRTETSAMIEGGPTYYEGERKN
ncbi:MAG TPA: YtxH domain-containing protein [Pyrinomonadaceae bacterium]|jgi:gas vesicle protein|nr:YtxH domain-containing protein [Pyrinomonadaceae bacterium]